jgi:predicted secreted protein
MTDALLGYGTKVAIKDNGSYADLDEVISVTPPNQQVEQVEATHTQSPNRTREYISGLNDPGECSFDMNFVPGSSSDTRLLALKTSGAYKDTRITFPNAVTWDFLASVTGYEPQAPIDDRMIVTVTMRVSGPTTITLAP